MNFGSTRVELVRRRRKGARGGDVKAVRRAVATTLRAEGVDGREVSVLLTDDREIQSLNLAYRGFDKPTDVLAFALDESLAVDEGSVPVLLFEGLEGLDVPGLSPPAGEGSEFVVQGGESGGASSLGDVVISVERARAQAASRRVTLDAELELLAVHGTLHLLGYDHADADEARVMRNRTRAVRRRLAKGEGAST
ncbi:MAG: rRNA maturation RNase YbeY [Myxococcota bacterium]